jgi:geranylgeranyl reductase family protein
MINVRLSPAYDSDFVIVGAGPAGSALSRHLADKGYRVILADREKFPRDKVCGDFLSPVSLRELENLGITHAAEFRQTQQVRSAGICMDGELLITSRIPQVKGFPPHGRVIPRRRLDNWLLSAARHSGVDVLEHHRAESYTAGKDGVTVNFRHGNALRTITARALIGADGSSSVIARVLRGYATPREDRIVAIRAYFEGVENLSDTAFLFFNTSSFPGYCWLFPTGPRSANVGFGFLSGTLPPAEINLRESLDRWIREDPALNAHLRRARMVGKATSWPLTIFNPHHPIAGDRVMLVGDAAGLINPLNGEGIQYALQSARWAADTLDEAARQDNFSGERLQEYAVKVHEGLRYDMAISRAVIQLIRNRTLNPVWMRTIRIVASRAGADPAYGDVIGGVLSGIMPVRRLMEPGVVGNTLSEAAVYAGDEVAGCLKDPRRLDALSTELFDSVRSMGDVMVKNPAGVFGWTCGIVDSSVELALQTTRGMIPVR